uniref:Ion transport domain-containing protein n=1 Tax=Anopheles epiroticus TaxID=199890 RepID=A0A182P4H0_9DIPT
MSTGQQLKSGYTRQKNPETGEYPIHLAARSFDAENLSELLNAPRIFVDQKFEDRTALYYLFDEIHSDSVDDRDNWKEVFECIKLLLKKNANINATDENSVSPIALLVTGGSDPWRKEILDYCLQNYSVNVDFRRKQARKAIEKNFPGTIIPEIDMEHVTMEVLKDKLSFASEQEFLEAFEKYCEQNDDHVSREEDFTVLLNIALRPEKLQAAKKLVKAKPELLSGLLAKCCIRGNVPMLEWLLEILPADAVKLVNEDPLLSLLVKQIDVCKDKNKCPYFRSMGILLNDPRIEVDKIDEKRCTALQYAVRYKIDHARELLLTKGAYIGGKDMFGDEVIDEMDSFLLEKHLDSCVTNNDRKPDDKDYKVMITFRNFIPPAYKQNAGKNTVNKDEMQTIARMAEATNTKQLVWHPVISSILLLKSMRLIWLLNINLFASCLFVCSFMMYIVLYYAEDNASVFKTVLYCLSWTGWVYLTVRELMQFALSFLTYIKSMQNVIELVLIVLSLLVLLSDNSVLMAMHQSWLLVTVLVLLGIELTLQLGMLPVNSIYTSVVMLKTVTIKFFQILSFNMIILLSFMFSFYKLFRLATLSAKKSEQISNATSTEHEELFNNFGSLGLGAMKATAMLAGELDASSLPFDSSVTLYFLFPVFVLSVVIVMNNLMTGVAVDDTRTIQEESDIVGIRELISMICKLEQAQDFWDFFCHKVLCLQRTTRKKVLSKIAFVPEMLPTLTYESLTVKHQNRKQGNRTSINVDVERAGEAYELLPLEKHKEVITFDERVQLGGKFNCIFFNGMLNKIVKSSMKILELREKPVFCVEFQLALAASFHANDLSEFRRALRNGANVNLRDRDTRYTVFELACKTPGKKQFIQACMNHGAAVSEKNPETSEYPIHLAALSFDTENLSELLNAPRILVDQKFEDRTALFLLFEQIDSDNWKEVFGCIKLLLKYYADINATDENSVSPIALLVTGGSDPWRKEILDYCLQNYSVNVDFRRKQARKAIEKNFPGTIIPEIDMEHVTVEVLRNKLSSATEQEFLEAFEKYCEQNNGHVSREEDFTELLTVSVYRAKLQAAKRLVQGYLVERKFAGKPELLSGLLAKCCIRGNVPMLEWLLEIIPADAVKLVNEDPLLSLLVKQIDVYKDKNKCPYFRSMGILLNDPRIEVDKIDGKRCTALHYAVRYKIDHAQELLLAKGAYIGGEDLLGDLPISEMDSFLLEQHLDSCVTNNDRKPGDEDYEVRINFSNFIPPAHKPNHGNSELVPFSGLPYEDEMRPIVRMAQSSSTKRLLRHPVISSILLLKWLKLICFFYINLVICTIFFVSFTAYVVFCYGREDAPFKLFFYFLSLAGWVYLIARELIQFLLNMRVYVRSAENAMEVLLILASGAVLMREFGDETRRVASACVILLSALEFTLLVGTLPVLSISTHMVMLKTVSKNFLKCLVLYSIILVAFAFSFYTLFRVSGTVRHPVEATTDKTEGMQEADGDDDQFNQFGEVPLALMKTAVMLTGEFEAANIKFQQSSLSYIIFALFLFFVSIVLFNLMNGLAVSDTTTIKAEAEIIGITQKVILINKYENALKTSKPIRCITERLAWFFPSNSLQLFSNNQPLKYIAVKPNQSNAIMISSLVPRYAHDVEKGDLALDKELEVDGLLQSNTKYGTECCIMPCLNNMDGKIVKYALEILHSRREKVGSIEYRMSRMEQSLERIAQDQLELRKLMQSFITSLEARSS